MLNIKRLKIKMLRHRRVYRQIVHFCQEEGQTNNNGIKQTSPVKNLKTEIIKLNVKGAGQNESQNVSPKNIIFSYFFGRRATIENIVSDEGCLLMGDFCSIRLIFFYILQ